MRSNALSDKSLGNHAVRRVRRRHPNLGWMAILVAITLLSSSCNFGRKPDFAAIVLPTPTLTLRDVYTVARGPVIESAVFTGKLVLASQQELSFSTSGRIQSVYVESGDQVAPDQIIATLDTRDLDFAVQDALLALNLAQQKLAEAQEELVYDTQYAQIELNVANRRLESLRSQIQVDATEMFIQELRVQQAQLRLARLEQGVDPRLTTEVTRAELTLRRAQASLADAQIVAPFAGEIRLFPALVEGNPSAAWEPVAYIVDSDTLQVETNLVSEDLEMLLEGMRVDVELVSRPSLTFSGEIYQLPQPFGSGMDAATKIKLDADTRLRNLRAGSAVTIRVEIQRANDTLWIPPQAVRDSTEGHFVVVRDGEDVREVEVRVGLRTGDRVQIVSGLREGDVVIGS